MSDSTQSSYKQIMKATSIFGGVQIFQILIGIIRSKFIALILGPAGIGLVGLYMTATSLIQTLTSFGLSTSAVKDIAEANESDDHERISKVSSVLNKLVWITGLSGALIVVLFSKYLSILTFGNPNYTWAFIWLSSTLVLNQITSGQYVILQGMRQIKKLAKANVFGSFFGLIIVIPLYYYYGIDGVVPGIISMAITSLLVSVYYSGNFKYKKSELSIDETITIGKGMLKMGFMLSLTSVFTAISAYILRVIISNLGGINDVGYYSAGFTIIITYTGMIFNAMSTDYYPKLSAISNDNTKSISLINNQAEVGILLLSPILLIFIIFINWIIVGLYSQEFLIITKMIHWAALGMYFKAASWSVAFILLAKGNSKVFFWNELAVNIYMLCLNVLGYYLFGLEGLGVSFLLSYIIYTIQIYYTCRTLYSFKFTNQFYKFFFIQLSLGIFTFIITLLLEGVIRYLLGMFFILVSLYSTFYYLNKQIDVKSNVENILNKYRKNE